MNTNAVADALYDVLSGLYERVYRNAPSSNVVFPYVVFNAESITDTYPSLDYYVYVDVFDSPSGLVRPMERIADNIQSNLSHTVINNSSLTMQMELVTRQFISADDLTTSKMINMQFSCRVYFKNERSIL